MKIPTPESFRRFRSPSNRPHIGVILFLDATLIFFGILLGMALISPALAGPIDMSMTALSIVSGALLILVQLQVQVFDPEINPKTGRILKVMFYAGFALIGLGCVQLFLFIGITTFAA